MSASRKIYEGLALIGEDERIARLKTLKRRELSELLHYAQGHAGNEFRDGVQMLVLMISGQRYLERVHRKLSKKAQRIS